MSTYIRTSSKSGVTGVTRVTTYAKRPNSLAFTPVTRMLGCPTPGVTRLKRVTPNRALALLRANSCRVLKEAFRW